MHPPNNAAAVLVIENDDDIRDSLTDILTMQGYRVVGVPTTRAVVNLFPSEFRACVIILDPFTRNGSGRSLTELAANPEWVNTPVIVGLGDGDTPRPIADGPLRRHYLRKPLDLAELFGTLDVYLGGLRKRAATKGRGCPGAC
jgi:DNA-binding NtrC family response regulator